MGEGQFAHKAKSQAQPELAGINHQRRKGFDAQPWAFELNPS
jgi:hypothetical protein